MPPIARTPWRLVIGPNPVTGAITNNSLHYLLLICAALTRTDQALLDSTRSGQDLIERKFMPSPLELLNLICCAVLRRRFYSPDRLIDHAFLMVQDLYTPRLLPAAVLKVSILD